MERRDFIRTAGGIFLLGPLALQETLRMVYSPPSAPLVSNVMTFTPQYIVRDTLATMGLTPTISFLVSSREALERYEKILSDRKQQSAWQEYSQRTASILDMDS